MGWTLRKRRNPSCRAAVATVRRMYRQIGSLRIVASCIGCDWRTITNWLDGIDRPSPANVRKINRAADRPMWRKS